MTCTKEELKVLKPGDKIKWGTDKTIWKYSNKSAKIITKEKAESIRPNITKKNNNLYWIYPDQFVTGNPIDSFAMKFITILETTTSLQINDFNYCQCSKPILVESYVRPEELFMFCKRCKKEGKQ